MQKKILVIGSANMDIALNMFKIPEPGQTVIDDGGVSYVPGGKGANAAIAFKKLGADCVFCTKVGADLHGQKLYQYYKELGLDTAFMKVDRENPTGLAAVLKEGDGNNRIIVYPGANSYLNQDNVIEAFDCNPDAVYLGFEIPFAVVVSAAKIATSRSIPVFIDAAPADKEYPLENLPVVDIFSPNETETFEFTGIMPQGVDSSLRASLALYKRVKCKYLVIKQGERGAFLYDGRHYTFIPALKAGKVVDTTAAGDAFTAAMTLAYLDGGDIKDAIHFGMAAGALTVTRKGASQSIPSMDEIVDFLNKGGV